jgi:hypothetical protein
MSLHDQERGREKVTHTHTHTHAHTRDTGFFPLLDLLSPSWASVDQLQPQLTLEPEKSSPQGTVSPLPSVPKEQSSRGQGAGSPVWLPQEPHHLQVQCVGP